jgi:Electron transfer flavoprotein, alpha subunit
MNGCNGGNCQTGSCDSPDGCRLPPGMLREYYLDQSIAEDILVWIEIVRNGEQASLTSSSLKVLAETARINNGRTIVGIIGDIELKLLYDEIFSYGAGTIYHVKDKRLKEFHCNAYCESLADISQRIVPAAILMASTERGNRIAFGLAAMLNVKCITDSMHVELSGRSLKVKDRSLKEVSFENFPQIATIDANNLPEPLKEEGRKGTVIYRQYNGCSLGE